MMKLSYVHGASTKLLIGETIGVNFDGRTVRRSRCTDRRTSGHPLELARA